MKRSAVFVLAATLLAGASAFAAGDPRIGMQKKLNPIVHTDNRGRDNRGNDNRGNDNRGRDNRGNDNRGRDNRDHDRRDHDRRDNDHNRGDDRRHDNNRRDHDRRDNDRRDHDRRDWDRNRHDNRNDHRDDWSRNRYQHGWDRPRSDWNRHPNYWDNRRHDRRDYARYRYNYGYYHAPRGYYYRTWHRGDRLPRSWYGNSYVVYDWRPYRLYAPPYGYHWVRVGDDVVLTAIATGIVLDVLYDIWY
jgi:Ni/Co efflux regulator RcnB